MAEYDVSDVISALRVISVFLPDKVMVGFEGMDVLIRDNRGLVAETRKLALHDAAERPLYPSSFKCLNKEKSCH